MAFLTEPSEEEIAIMSGNKEPASDWTEVVGAAFAEENMVGATAFRNEISQEFDDRETLQTRRGPRKQGEQFPVEESFNPYDTDLTGYEDMMDEFMNVRSPKELEFTKSLIDGHKQNQKIIEDAGAGGVTALVAAGVLDPSILVPYIGVANKVKTAGNVLKSVAVGGGQLGAIEAGREAYLQDVNPTRTMDESIRNVGFATVLGGVLGPLISQVPKSTLDDIAKGMEEQLAETPNMVPKRAGTDSMGAAAVKQTTMEDETVVGGRWIEWMMTGPAGRLAKSASLGARRLTQQLARDSFLRNKHQKGIASEMSWEDITRSADGELDEVLIDIQQQWKNYSNRVPKDQRTIHSLGEFEEAVAGAARRGDVSDIGEVASAAGKSRKVMDRILDDAVEAGFLPKVKGVLNALSYLPRSYNLNKIRANEYQFKQQLKSQLSKTLDPDEFLERADEIVDDIVNNIKGAPDKGAEGKILSTSASNYMKGRTLDMSDEFLEEWLDSNMSSLLTSYHKTMQPKIAFYQKFGKDTLDDLKIAIRKEYDELKRAAANDPKKTKELDSQLNSDLKDIDVIYNRGMGTVDNGLKADGGLSRTISSVKEINRQRLLGGVSISSLADIARPIVINGVRPYIKMITKMAFSPEFRRLAGKEKKLISAALERTLQTRVRQMADVGNDYVGGTKFERGLEWTGNKFSAATLLPMHNEMWKTFSGVIAEDFILTTATKMRAGKNISTKQLQKLARFGLDKNDLEGILKQYEAHGSKSGKSYAAGNFEMWDDLGSANKVRNALNRIANETINTPGIGTLPNMFDSKIAGAMLQFKSFLFASHQQTLIAGLQQNDAAFWSSVIAMTGMGAGITAIKDTIKDRDMPDSPEEWIFESIDRTGVLSLLIEANNTADKVTQGKVSMQRALGISSPRRFATRSSMEQLLGPSAGFYVSSERFVNAAMEGDMSEGDINKAVQMLPFQNLFYLRLITDKVSEELK